MVIAMLLSTLADRVSCIRDIVGSEVGKCDAKILRWSVSATIVHLCQNNI